MSRELTGAPGLRLHPGFSLRTLAALCTLLGALSAQSVTVTPDPLQFVLQPGQTVDILAELCLPGQAAKVDVYLLADTTTSMTPILDQVKANVVQIVSTLLATPNVDLRVGVGQYRDFPFDPLPFEHQVNPTTDQAALANAITSWVAAGGGDGSEGQFWALHRLATDPAIGFRPDAKRIIVWFGDSPAHDPICALFVGGGVPTFEISEADVTAALASAGPGGTAVIAIGTSTGYPLALNDDPNIFAEDYEAFCAPNGTAGQADRIAAASNGLSTTVADPVGITDAILDAVASLLVAVDATVVVSPSIAAFVTAIDPVGYEDAPLPTDPDETLCLPFTITLTGPPCDGKQYVHHGTLELLLNGSPISSHAVTIVQPGCNTTPGVLLGGLRRIEPVVAAGGGPEDLILIHIGMRLTVPIGGGLPALAIPNDAALVGFEIYLQAGLFDPLNYPEDPLKLSNGLVVPINAAHLGLPSSTAFGAGSGLLLSLLHPAGIGGHLKLAVTFAP